VPAEFVEDQLEAVFKDMGADAVKIGMLNSVEVVEIVARQLEKHSAKNVVLDPVMVSQSGDRLLQDKAMEAVNEFLMPIVSVFTPNLPEASAILKCQISTMEDMRKAAIQLAYSGVGSILIKGGHLDGGESTDIFYICLEDRFVDLKAERIVTRNNHGTGCTLSSAIASYLAKGFPLEKAVRKAKEYITEAIRAGSRLIT